jgi:hypothetical protein
VSAGFTTVRTVGGVLPPDLLSRVIAGDPDLGGWSAADFHLAAGESPREAANRAWSYLVGVWDTFRGARERLPAGDPAVGVTRERWLMLLLRELGYGRVPTTRAGGLQVGDRAFPVSHLWGRVPMHLLGWGVELDRRTKGVPGAAERAPHAMVQELLNRTDDQLWAIVSNGRILRLLRDSTNLSGQSYVEFDLEAMFDGEVFSDFALLFFLLHESRVGVPGEDDPASGCWLERWRTTSIESGTRALQQLRVGVQRAIEALGTGFLQGPGGDVHRRLADGELRVEDFHRSLLRLVYRLLFLFVAEDRGALLDPNAAPVAAARYEEYFSTARLRRLSLRRHGTRHTDLWEALSLVIDALGRAGGRPELGLPGLGGLFEHGPLDVVAGQPLTNDRLLAAIRQLHVVQLPRQPKRTVDYRNLGAEELGGVYESLLELVPRFDRVERSFSLEALAGNLRKTSGSYYTPTALIDLVLDEALDPLLDDAEKSDHPEAALLDLTVCDPACGSGHFLVAAARRIADRLAVARTGEVDPTPESQQAAMHDVVSRCVYGLDVNPMAAELAKVSLWLEALQPTRPLTFLDAHIKVGDSLLGTTPALLADGIPDGAFSPIEGDDRKHATVLRKLNRTERESGQLAMDGAATTTVSNRALRKRLDAALPEPPKSLEDLQVAQRRYRDYERSAELRAATLRADAWCAAFVQPKAEGSPAITTGVLDNLRPEQVALVEQLRDDYRLFHWHLEFPGIFDVPEAGAGTQTGWLGGFSAMVGNPPWERVKLQEKEFFDGRDDVIATAKNAADRKRLIAKLPETNPVLAAEWAAAQRVSQGASQLIRSSGRYPLCGVGDINTYSVFAEHFRSAINPRGRMGIITPTGLATDATTSDFFADTLHSARLAAFYDFENEAKIFPGVHHAFRFAITSMTGGERVDQARLAFVVRHVADVPTKRFALAADEALMLNPNTGTLPVFRSRTDAEITLGVYRRHPVLVRDGDAAANPWDLRFRTLFHMANDSGLFESAVDLKDLGAEFDGWAWSKGRERWLPLYEAKLLSHYDCRYSTYAGATDAELRMQTLPRVTDDEHDDPNVEPLARYWVVDKEVDEAIGDRWDRDWLFGWRDITGQEKWRTFVPSVLPRSAVGHVFPLAFPAIPEWVPLLQATWSSLACDYTARQKLSGTHMTYGVLEQIACPAPATFDTPPGWDARAPLKDWVLPRLLELSYTSWRLQPYARDMGDDGPPYRWLPDRRELLRAELDAAMFHVYGLTRAETEHVLDAFPVLRKYEERDHGEFRTRRLVLEIYDAMQQAAASGTPYQTRLDPPPGRGPRHTEK